MVLRRSIKYHKCNQLGNQKTEHLNAHACGKSSTLHSINKQKKYHALFVLSVVLQ